VLIFSELTACLQAGEAGNAHGSFVKYAVAYYERGI